MNGKIQGEGLLDVLEIGSPGPAGRHAIPEEFGAGLRRHLTIAAICEE